MKRSIPLLLLSIVFLGSLSSLPVTVSWVEGSVDIRSGSSWRSLEIGSVVDSASTVRLGRASFAEFAAGAKKISLTSEGSYILDSLLASAAEQGQKRSDVVAKMGRMVSKQAPRSTVVAGVRGDFEGAAPTTTWAVDDDDPEALAKEAQKYLSRDEYAQAAELYGMAALDSLGDAKNEYLYAQAWSFAADDNPIGAIKALRTMDSSGMFSLPRSILLARLSLDTGAARDAAALLDEVSRDPSLAGEEAKLVADMRAEANKLLARP
jgi:hypothetical protein